MYVSREWDSYYMIKVVGASKDYHFNPSHRCQGLARIFTTPEEKSYGITLQTVGR